MAQHGRHRIACVTVWSIVGLLSSATTARAQIDFTKPPEAEAQAAAAKANPELVNGLAKELGSTPEQAAGAAGVFFSLAKSLLKPEDFAAMTKAVPGMDALLAATPAGVVVTPSALTQTPGFASSPSATSGAMMAAPDGMTSAVGGLSKIGIKPEMIAKALPYLSGYLKKYGGAALGSLLGGLFKGGKPGQ